MNLFIFNSESASSKIRAILLSCLLIILILPSTNVQAVNIVGVSIGGVYEVPFLLDDEGYVWAFKKPNKFEEPFKLPNLKNIKTIAPYIAIDAQGQVFTWRVNPDKTFYELYEGYTDAEYFTPQKVENLSNVTKVASSDWNYFAAVVDNKEIVVWGVTPETTEQDVHYEPVHPFFSRQGVKAITVNHLPGYVITGHKNRVVFASLVALYDNGDVLGWNITASGVSKASQGGKGIVLTQQPGAMDIALSAAHTVVLSAKGSPIYWGACGRRTDFMSEVDDSHTVNGEGGFLNDVKALALFAGDDNAIPSTFIKQDGSVWLAETPAPSGLSSEQCSQNERKIHTQKISADNVIASKVASSSDLILVLDVNHQLWYARPDGSIGRKQNMLTKLKINLQ